MDWKLLIRKIARMLAKRQQMTEGEREEQRKSFAYGNAKLSNENITREIIEEVLEQERKEFELHRRNE